MNTDPIADMLTRIRNAISVNKHEVRVPYSKLKRTVADQLAASGFIAGVDVDESAAHKELLVRIFEPGTNPRITHVERVSKPGRRLYAKANDIPVIKNGRGVMIVSTSQGVMTGREATNKRLGGELICMVY